MPWTLDEVAQRKGVLIRGACSSLGILTAFAEPERRRIKERQAEGIALVKANGKYAQQSALNDEDVKQVKALVELGYPKTEIARQYQVSRQAIYNALKRS